MASRRKKYQCLLEATELAAYKIEHSKPLNISVNFIRSLHKELYLYYKSAAGNFRTPVYNITVTSQTLLPVPPAEIRSRLLSLTLFINNKHIKAAKYKSQFTSKIKGYKDLKREIKKFWFAIFCASYVHYQITFIHPFTGGNGRLARLLMSMELASHGIYRATFPPKLNEAIKMNRDRYLDVLGIATKEI